MTTRDSSLLWCLKRLAKLRHTLPQSIRCKAVSVNQVAFNMTWVQKVTSLRTTYSNAIHFWPQILIIRKERRIVKRHRTRSTPRLDLVLLTPATMTTTYSSLSSSIARRRKEYRLWLSTSKGTTLGRQTKSIPRLLMKKIILSSLFQQCIIPSDTPRQLNWRQISSPNPKHSRLKLSSKTKNWRRWITTFSTRTRWIYSVKIVQVSKMPWALIASTLKISYNLRLVLIASTSSQFSTRRFWRLKCWSRSWTNGTKKDSRCKAPQSRNGLALWTLFAWLTRTVRQISSLTYLRTYHNSRGRLSK